MLTIALIALLGQTGICKPGINCSGYSFTASAPSGSVGFSSKIGARECYDYPTCSKYCYVVSSTRLCVGLTEQGSFASSVEDGFFSTVASSKNAFSVATAGARIDYGPGLNDWASSDGGVVHFQSTIDIGSGGAGTGITANANGNFSASGSGYFGMGNVSGGFDSLGRLSSTSEGYPLSCVDTEGFRIIGVTSANLTALDGGFAGTLQYDTTNDKMTLVEGNFRRFLHSGLRKNFGCSGTVDFGSITNGTCASALTVACTNQPTYRAANVSGAPGSAEGIMYFPQAGDAGFVEVVGCNVTGAPVDPTGFTMYFTGN